MIEVDPDLLSFLRDEEGRSRNDDLVMRAETALKSYNGEPYGDEEDGRSQVVTRDVAEVVDQMQISVLRQFVSGDNVVEFEPLSKEDEQGADDATQAIQRQFSRKGYRLLHDWFKEGNLCTLGIVKTTAEAKKVRETFITADPEADGAIEADELPDIIDELGAPLFQAVRLVDGPVEFKDYLVPLEEFRISPDARELDEAAYLAHATPKYVSELVEMGFDKAEVEDLQADMAAEQVSYERDNRYTLGDERKGAMRRVLLLEEYVRFDLDGDGIAERLCVHRVGDHVLKIEEVDYHPFVAYCPFPMPGRLVGHALAEKVIDIQRITTVLLRGHLDGQYANLAPGYIVPDTAVNENTYDDLLTIRPNRIIRTTGQGQIEAERRNDTSASSLAAMEFMIGQREARTGITRLNQGLDADALNKTATGTALMQAQGQQMEEYLARNFAESVAALMVKKHGLMRKYGQPFELRVDGEFRQIDPSAWPSEFDVITRVGLGSGKKEQRVANRMLLMQVQRECMAGGLPIVGPEQIYKSGAGLVKDTDLGSVSDFFIDPSTIQPPVDENGQPLPPEPSPEEKQMQAELQLQAAKMQGERQIAAMKLEALREEAALKAQLARDEATAAAELAAAKAQAELDLAERKFAMEVRMEQERLTIQAEQSRRDADRRDYEADAKISQNRKGGDLDK